MKILIVLCVIFSTLTACARRDDSFGGPLPIIGWGGDGFAGFPQYFLQEPTDIFPSTVRVLINTCGFVSLVHETVEITGTGAFWVWCGEGEARFEAGEVFRVTDGLARAARFYIAPEYAGDRLKILGLTRNHPHGATPQYRGVFEVTRVEGGFTIINELYLEEYLYAVVPSEMPSSFGVEASKVQAVTARTFAVHQIRQSRFRDFGAHVDDSVISQVYNNLPENDISIEAVRATRGRVLKFDGEIILANYFSTSGGTTANFGEVWADGDVFPAYTPEFLRARAQFTAHEPGNLRTEAAAAAFFRCTEIPAFDREFPWFRWEVTMTVDELSERINASLAARQTANPALVEITPTTASANAAAAIGTLQSLYVTRRGQGGNIMEMAFHGTAATARVRTEFNIRALLAPGDIPVTRHDGSQSGRLGLLPSAFFTMELHKDAQERLAAVTFYGGGNGHGVGMSQNGVRALLSLGLTYTQILHHFYPGAEIVQR